MKTIIKKTVGKFLEEWGHDKDIIGVVVCGSYVTGNPTKHSDIDLQIILSEGIRWRERGNRIINGILVEYFANPPKQIKAYMEEDFKGRRQMAPHMFFTGKIILDKKGIARKLKKLAKSYLSKKYSKGTDFQIKNAKYSLWDMQDNLEEVYEASKGDFRFVYYNYLAEMLSKYSELIGFLKISSNKVWRFLSDENDKKKYLVKDFPDKKFVKLFIKAIEIKNEKRMFEIYQRLTNHILEKLGGFEVDGYKLKSDIDV